MSEAQSARTWGRGDTGTWGRCPAVPRVFSAFQSLVGLGLGLAVAGKGERAELGSTRGWQELAARGTEFCTETPA